MYKFIIGNILTAEAEALVNTVNTYGVMGKGIALAFKKSFPENFKAYRKAFDSDELEVGQMHVHKTSLLAPKFIINFPTKKHWRHKSKLQYIESGLDDLIKVINENQIRSIAIPPLGCGNGGLDWNIVKKLITDKLNPLQQSIEIVIYEPRFNLKIRSVKPITQLNPTRAIYLQIIRQYELLGEDISTLVVQKLAYLLQRMGEKLNLRFDKGIYGPYSPNLNKVIEALSPNYLNYNGDLNSPLTYIKLVQENKAEAKDIIENKLDSHQKERLNSIQNLIDGFESTLGLELLATVAFAIEQCPNCSKEEIISDIHNWTKRKKELMSEHMISVSYDRLRKFSL